MGALNRAILNLERQLGDEWQQAPSLDLLPLELGPIGPRAWSPGLAKEDHSAQTLEPAVHSRSLFYGSDCLSSRSQLRTAMGRTRARVIVGCLQE